MYWRDVRSDAPGAAWLGLECAITSVTSRPRLHLQAGSSWFMRLHAGGTPRVWARIAPDHFGYWYLRGEPVGSPHDRVLPPLTFAMARAIEGGSGTERWYAGWCREFFRLLEESPCSPLHAGRWWMTPCPADLHDEPGYRHPGGIWPGIPPASFLDQVPNQPPHAFSQWDFHDDLPPLALRAAVPDGHGRLKAWRKAAREGWLPPVLLWWVSGLDRFVIVDGHVRLQAAVIEGRTPPILALLGLRPLARRADPRRTQAIAMEVAAQLDAARRIAAPRGRPFSVESGNRLLIEAFDDRSPLRATTHAWPMRGGVPSWLDEVRRRLGALPPGCEVDREMAADPGR